MAATTRSTSGVVGGCVVVFAALLAYSNTFNNGFVWDDASSVLIHRTVQDPSRFFELFTEDQHAYGRGQGNFYRPLVAASFMLDYALAASPDGSLSPFLFHVTNLFWHAAACLLLMVLLLRLGAPLAVAAAVACVYAVHPLHTEAITYISGRADPMAAAFLFAALYCALWEGSSQQRIAGAVASGMAFAVALLCKESALIYVPLLALCALAAPPQTNDPLGPAARIRRRGPALIAGALLTLGYVLLRTLVLRFGTDSSPRNLSVFERVGEFFGAFALYIKLTFVPTGLHMERTLAGQSVVYPLMGALLLLATIAGVLWALRRGRSRVAIGLLWFLVTWLPISGIVPLNAPMAEHWMYLPLAGLLWALAELCWPLVQQRRLAIPAAGAVAIITLVFIALCIDRNRDWRDNESIYLATIEKNPGTIRVHYNLGVTYEDLIDNAPGARRHFERVLALYDQRRAAEGQPDAVWEDEIDARLSLGRLYLADLRYTDAAREFSTVLNLARGASAQSVSARAVMGLAACYISSDQNGPAAELVARITNATEMQAAVLYFRKVFTRDARLSDKMQQLLAGIDVRRAEAAQPSPADPTAEADAAASQPRT